MAENLAVPHLGRVGSMEGPRQSWLHGGSPAWALRDADSLLLVTVKIGFPLEAGSPEARVAYFLMLQ